MCVCGACCMLGKLLVSVTRPLVPHELNKRAHIDFAGVSNIFQLRFACFEFVWPRVAMSLSDFVVFVVVVVASCCVPFHGFVRRYAVFAITFFRLVGAMVSRFFVVECFHVQRTRFAALFFSNLH